MNTTKSLSQLKFITGSKGDRLPAQKVGRDYLIKVSDLALVSDRKPGRPPKEKEESASSAKKKSSKK